MLCWLRLIETHIIFCVEGLSSPEPCLLLGYDSEDVDRNLPGEEEESSFAIDIVPGRKEGGTGH